jgi:hypothetical protein
MSWMWQLDAGRLEAVGAQNPGDGAGRDPAAKVQQLPADALVAPTVGSRWPAARSRSGPGRVPVVGRVAGLDRSNVGAPCGGAIEAASRRDHEDRPSGPGQETTERRQQRAVFGLEPRPWVLAAQNCQLVAEDQDLNLFRVRRAPAEHQQLKHTAQRQVDERPDHQHLQRTAAHDGAP